MRAQAIEIFLPIAIMEHHQTIDPVLDVYDICNRLAKIWSEIRQEARTNTFTLDADCILSINQRIARSFDIEAGTFRGRDEWLDFVKDVGDIEEDPDHVLSWIFSTLYWHHLTKFKLATVWLFNNALRVQYGYPECILTLDNLGKFLDSLSGSGPPIYDGQTFYPDDYSRSRLNMDGN